MPELATFFKTSKEIIETVGFSTFILIIIGFLVYRYYPSVRDFLKNTQTTKQFLDNIEFDIKELREDYHSFKETLASLTTIQETIVVQFQTIVNRLLDIIEKERYKNGNKSS